MAAVIAKSASRLRPLPEWFVQLAKGDPSAFDSWMADQFEVQLDSQGAGFHPEMVDALPTLASEAEEPWAEKPTLQTRTPPSLSGVKSGSESCSH